MESYITTTVYSLVGGFSFIFMVMMYNRIVNYNQSVQSAFSSINVELKKRADLIPEAINAAKAFVRHEDQLMKNLTELRVKLQGVSMDEKESYMKKEQAFFKGFMAVAESYPNLRSSTVFVKLQAILEETEKNIAASRHIYNSNVDYYNSYINSFPAMIVAGLFSYGTKEYLSFDKSVQTRVKVPTNFNDL